MSASRRPTLSFTRNRGVAAVLASPELIAVRRLVARVAREVTSPLLLASLFGSRARGDARADSDIDVLLVFRWLPPDREPHATQAERIAASVAADTAVPVNVWCVSLRDLVVGNRTPMLIDALDDSILIWSGGSPVEAVTFTPADAIRCGDALLARVAEGSGVFASARVQERWGEAARRARDDIVRLCTAWLLLHGVTRPRRAEAVRRFARAAYATVGLPTDVREILAWAARSFGPDGRDEVGPVPVPPGGLASIGPAIDHLRALVRAAEADLRRGAPLLSPNGRATSARIGAPLLRHLVYDTGAVDGPGRAVFQVAPPRGTDRTIIR